ncbi:hypothetical protein [Lederbergia lenta]|uniref:hypothetical protein n=1 Tax=Lederbergia lenta TaxID=1467 RepID=UPI00204102AE|nr:hypothetical protein [Lederbergia lenta]MCM3111695.1 hypothetical protein [Lederbergia lenta]
MSISNFKQKRQFVKSIGDYTKFTEGLAELGDKQIAISNLEYMQEQFNTLTASGRLTENNVKYGILSAYLEQATSYLTVTDPRLPDVINHYATCKDFYSITSSLLGDENDV